MKTQTLHSTEVLVNSLTGDQLIFSADDFTTTHPHTLRMEAIYKPAGKFAPEHYHPYQDEQFEVISGKLMTKINGVVREYQTGEKFTVLKGTPHAMYNASTEAVHFAWEVTPALQTKAFFRQAYSTINNHQVHQSKIQCLIDTLTLLKKFQHLFVLTKIPLFIQKALFRYILPVLIKK